MLSRLKRYDEEDDKPTTGTSTDKENQQPNLSACRKTASFNASAMKPKTHLEGLGHQSEIKLSSFSG